MQVCARSGTGESIQKERLLTQPNRSVAAPGKVLLTGGYLITERGYGGVVLVTDALFVTVRGRIGRDRVHVESSR